MKMIFSPCRAACWLVFSSPCVLTVPGLRAADAAPVVAKPEINTAVTVTDNGGNWTLENGVVKATIDKRSGRMTALVYHGINTLGGGGYWEQSPAGATDSLTIDPAKNGGERAEVSVKGAPGRGIDIELRYSLARGQGPDHEFVRDDAMHFLTGRGRRAAFDLAVVDAPTFSNSKSLEDYWDIQRNHVELLNRLVELMTPGGLIFFSTNFRRFKLAEAEIRGVTIREISRQTVPADFRNRRIHRCWRMVRRQGSSQSSDDVFLVLLGGALNEHQVWAGCRGDPVICLGPDSTAGWGDVHPPRGERFRRHWKPQIRPRVVPTTLPLPQSGSFWSS